MQKLRDIENEAKGILELLKIKNTDLVLEIGTGTGELALKLSGHCKKEFKQCWQKHKSLPLKSIIILYDFDHYT